MQCQMTHLRDPSSKDPRCAAHVNPNRSGAKRHLPRDCTRYVRKSYFLAGENGFATKFATIPGASPGQVSFCPRPFASGRKCPCQRCLYLARKKHSLLRPDGHRVKGEVSAASPFITFSLLSILPFIVIPLTERSQAGLQNGAITDI